MAERGNFLKSKKGLTFVLVMITLGMGILIGTIVSNQVSSVATASQANQLKIQGEGEPLALNRTVSLAEGFADVAKAIEPAVVNISTTAIIHRQAQRQQLQQGPLRDFFGKDFFDRFFGNSAPQEQKVTSLGSGIIVDSKGFVLTNYHVVARADKINVRLESGDNLVGQVVGKDDVADLAVVKIASSKPLPFAKIGDSSKLRVGDWVLAVGSPFGLEQSVTAGIVSATGRVGVTTGSGEIIPFPNIFGNYIQTDAAINPGNSGGPLVNMKGEVVGINTFISTRGGGSEGIGFAIPSTVLVNSYNQLVTKGKIERGWLGVSMNSHALTPEMAEFFGVAGKDPSGIKDGDGVLITQLIDEDGKAGDTGPAYKAGIRPEDVIVKFGNQEIRTNSDLRAAVANTPPGKQVPVVVVRHGKVVHLNVTLAERQLEQRQENESKTLSFEEKKQEERRKEIGLEFTTLEPNDAEKLGLEGEQGVLVTSVTLGSLADEAGLERNQVITNVNGERVKTAQEFRRKILSMPSGKPVILRVVYAQNKVKTTDFVSFTKP